MQQSEEIDEVQFKIEFEQRVELRKQWLLDEMKTSGKFLDVSAKKLDDLDALTIALYLHECEVELQLFHIGANSITDRGFLDMLTGLQWHTKLKEIYVGNNLISEIGIQGLIEVASNFRHLQILSMGGCQIDDQTFIQLCYQLPELPQLKQLQVPSNEIGDYGLICLSSLLATNATQITVLHLGGNPLTSKSVVPFMSAMSKNKSIKILYLNDIGLDMSSIRALAKMLKKNKTLEDLNLGNTGCSDSAAMLLWPNLKHLKSLHLWNNHLTDQAISDLLDVMEIGSISVTYLSLADNEIKNTDLLDDITSILKQNELIAQLDDKQSDSQDEEQQMKDQLDLAKVEEIEEKLQSLQQVREQIQEPQEDSLQGKLKKYVGQTEGELIHSILE